MTSDAARTKKHVKSKGAGKRARAAVPNDSEDVMGSSVPGLADMQVSDIAQPVT